MQERGREQGIPVITKKNIIVLMHVAQSLCSTVFSFSHPFYHSTMITHCNMLSGGLLQGLSLLLLEEVGDTLQACRQQKKKKKIIDFIFFVGPFLTLEPTGEKRTARGEETNAVVMIMGKKKKMKKV